MKQVIQNYRTGALEVVDVPSPQARPGNILVRNVCSAVSGGTERMVVDLAKKSLVGKGLARPDLVRRVIDKIRTDGFLETVQQVLHRLDTPVPLGYSCAGEVIAAGEGVSEFRTGELVACGGQGVATHSELVCVPTTLAALVPAAVTPSQAAFAMVGAIALHAVRLLRTELGDFVAVIGLGLLGQVAAQVLKASGCRVIGIEVSPEKANLARELGVEMVACQSESDPEALVQAATQARGVDRVLIMAATPSNDPIELAARLCRERGRIVATGLVGLTIPRQVFYEKELEFLVSRSSGPGLYDPDYEQHGHDYPYSYVRWTHRRNMAQFLQMVSSGQVQIDRLITHRFPIGQAPEAYDALTGDGSSACVGIVLDYPKSLEPAPAVVRLRPESRQEPRARLRVGVIGAGLFGRTTFLPQLSRIEGIELRGVVTASGNSAHHAARKFGFAYAATDAQEIIGDPEVDCVAILTRHHLHAKFVTQALNAGKDVFVEKPLALHRQELLEIVEAWRKSKGRLMVGFNRRHSPHAGAARRFLAGRGGLALINCRVNAGDVPRTSWVNDAVEGGGRILGEVCHFVDLVQFLTNSTIVKESAATLGANPCSDVTEDIAATVEMADGSIASILYTSKGHRSMTRERIEVFSRGSVCLIDNFRVTRFFGPCNLRNVRTWRQDRGYQSELISWVRALRQGDAAPVPFAEYVSATLATFALAEALTAGRAIQVDLGLLQKCTKG